MFAKVQRVHFVGIGGIGMSGIAEVLLNLGWRISGSDLKRSQVTERLQGLGATIFEGHRAENVMGAEVVVTSSAISSANPEVVEAARLHLPVIPRAEMLAELMRLKYGIAIAGMHGKTTTTSMVAAVLAGGGLDPTVVVGGRVDAMGSNARLGRSQYLVAEADESDRSFLKLSPILSVVTNVDREHMDCYRNMNDVKRTFLEFMDRVPFYGMLVLCNDDPILRRLIPKVRRRMVTYGTRKGSDFLITISKQSRSAGGTRLEGPETREGTASSVTEDRNREGHEFTRADRPRSLVPALAAEGNTSKSRMVSREGTASRRAENASLRKGALAPEIFARAPNSFHVSYRGNELGEFRLHVPGMHNVLNATAAIAVGLGLDVPVAYIREALENFRGVDRRFQLRGQAAGIAVIDDYGHHPTEIKATLAAARQCGYRKIHVIFQPHRYTRTRDLMEEFTTAFDNADSLFVLDIYPASEQPIEGITGGALASRIVEKNSRSIDPSSKDAGCPPHSTPSPSLVAQGRLLSSALRQDGNVVRYVSSFDDAVSAATFAAQPGDMILTLGAGSVSQLGPMLLEKLQDNQVFAKT